MTEKRRSSAVALRAVLLAATAAIGAASWSAAADPPTTAVPAPPDVAAPPRDAVRTPSGLFWKSLRPGVGTRHAMATDVVEIHYSGWTTDGKMFDSTVASEQPAVFPVRRILPGLQEAVGRMVEGERSRFWIPKEQAYGDGAGGRPAGMLVFDIDLIRIQ